MTRAPRRCCREAASSCRRWCPARTKCTVVSAGWCRSWRGGNLHLEVLTAVIADALTVWPASRWRPRASMPWRPRSAPGCVGALLVGLSAAKALALVWDVPFVAVNHLEAHLYAALLDHPEATWPLVVVLVSGGHTLVIEMAGPGRYRLLGQTLDDAAGEAFDKVARYLGLGYPGGPADPEGGVGGRPGCVLAFPRALMDDGLDLSFSGLKTSVVRMVEKHPGGPRTKTWRRQVPGRRWWTSWSPRRPAPRTPDRRPGALPGRWGGRQRAPPGLSRRWPRPRWASRPTCRAGRCAPITPPWWPPRDPGSSSTSGPPPRRRGADPGLGLRSAGPFRA